MTGAADNFAGLRAAAEAVRAFYAGIDQGPPHLTRGQVDGRLREAADHITILAIFETLDQVDGALRDIAEMAETGKPAGELLTSIRTRAKTAQETLDKTDTARGPH